MSRSRSPQSLRVRRWRWDHLDSEIIIHFNFQWTFLWGPSLNFFAQNYFMSGEKTGYRKVRYNADEMWPQRQIQSFDSCSIFNEHVQIQPQEN